MQPYLKITLMVEELKHCSVPSECNMCLILAQTSCISQNHEQQHFLNYLSFPLPPPQKRVSLCIYLFISWTSMQSNCFGFCDFLFFFFPMNFLFWIQQQGGGKRGKISCQCHWNHNSYKFTPLNQQRHLFIKHRQDVCRVVNTGREIPAGRSDC